ncbi:MAG: hypothetical protein QOH86_1168 [Sphingomonadales bacterium]|jgi:hypothetical protein|nr:hypothetical protein [Sphingomonadales bacterium]
MIRTSKAPVAWPVPWREGVKYFFRAGDVIERSEFEAELAGEHRADVVYPFEFAAAFADGVNALLADSPGMAAELIALAQAEAALAPGEKMPAEETADLEAARDLVTQHWPAYRQLVAQDVRRQKVAPTIAFRRYCTGWEGKDMPDFANGADGMVALDALAKLSGLDLKAGGAFAFQLQYGRGKDLEKNSVRPSSPAEGRKTSRSPRPKAGGTSRARGGSKTRSSPRRAGRSKS